MAERRGYGLQIRPHGFESRWHLCQPRHRAPVRPGSRYPVAMSARRRDLLLEGLNVLNPSYPMLLLGSYLTGYALGAVASLAWTLTRKVRP